MKITIKNLTNENDVKEMVENGIILTDEEVKAMVKEHNKNHGIFGRKSERGILLAYKMNVNCVDSRKKLAEKKLIHQKKCEESKNNIKKNLFEIKNAFRTEQKHIEKQRIEEENKLLNVLNNIAENGTTKRVKRDIPVCIEALQTLPNPEQLFTEDNTHTLLADLHIIRNILNNVKYADGKHFREAYGMDGSIEGVPASKYMSVADEVNNINSALHIKKLGYEMPSKDWEYDPANFTDINVLTDINLKGFRHNSVSVEFDAGCTVEHVLRVMLGVFEAINDFENADEVKRVLNSL